MNTSHIVAALGPDVVKELERAVSRGFDKSRRAGDEGIEAFETLLVSLLAATIASPGEISTAPQRAVACADKLEKIVSQMVRAQMTPNRLLMH